MTHFFRSRTGALGVVLFGLIVSVGAYKPVKVYFIRRDFVSDDWHRVSAAKSALVSMNTAAIPSLIALMQAPRVVRLTNTDDLFYPGARRNYGHGMYLAYELDVIPVRAGWVMEEITRQDFGFRAIRIKRDACPKTGYSSEVSCPSMSAADAEKKLDTAALTQAVSSATEWTKHN